MAHPIFNDWKDYDNLKKKGEDADFFSCTEKWEVAYLAEKIIKHFPQLDIAQIISAIEYCCEIASPPHPREPFVIYVLSRMGIKIS